MRVIATILFCLVGLGAPVFAAQSEVQVQKAQLAVPFGTASGTVVLAKDVLVFLDDTNPDASFAIRRSAIESSSADGDMFQVQTSEPVQAGEGKRSQFSFRMSPGSNPQVLADWAHAEGRSTPPTSTATANAGASTTYMVRHDHLVGGCEGRLIIGQDKITFESVSDVGHSRQWQLSDIQEIKHKNPYELKVVPFAGDTYDFDLEGKKMDTKDYQALVDRIAEMRASR